MLLTSIKHALIRAGAKACVWIWWLVEGRWVCSAAGATSVNLTQAGHLNLTQFPKGGLTGHFLEVLGT